MDSIQKQNIKDVKKETVKFNDTVKASRRILFRAKTVFPFDLFLDEIVIDENKVDIIYGIFFYSREVFSIPYRQINGVSSTTGIFFGGLQIEIEGFNKNPPFLNKL